MGQIVRLVFVALAALACIVPSHRHQAGAASPTDYRIRTEVAWRESLTHNGHEALLTVSLIVHGGETPTASACGNLEVDSIKDENGRTVELFGLGLGAGMTVIDRGSPFANPRDDGAQVSFSLRNPVASTKLSELRGSFALRTGGRFQEVVLKDAFRQTGRAIDDATLKRLGITVHIDRTTRPPQAESEPKQFTLSPPDDLEDSQDVVEIDVRTGGSPAWGYSSPYPAPPPEALQNQKTDASAAVIRLEITDANGKPISSMRSTGRYGSSIEAVKHCFKDKLPDASQLRLTLHRDSKEIRVPFALKDIAIPPKKQSRDK